MKYISTRNPALSVTPEQALKAGLAADGGLYVPASLPNFDHRRFSREISLPECASAVLAPFFSGSTLAERLDPICRQAFDLPLLIKPLPGREPAWMLELFHGPTAAFKDFAARFLARCLAAIQDTGQTPGQTVIVATSGDTGAAVAAAFHGMPGFRVVILYPDGRVSARQAHQLGAFGDNVFAFRVDGSFDDCQRMAKQALSDPALVARHGLTTANSISIGRLLPQISYYALAAIRLADAGTIDVVVPTGNLGNALACILARAIGFPIGDVYLATNANRTLSDYFAGADYQGRDGLQTLANAMDVGDPSNFERLAWLYRDRDPRAAGIYAESIDDSAIRACIGREFEQHGSIVCPHTACAIELLRRLRARGHKKPALVAATAHPAKFEAIIEPILGQAVPLPRSLQQLLARPASAQPLAADFEALKAVL
ncbi:MAG: threonine synthase [Wenzhouxiangellaceae bacterium]|nr:threonine synthase [Wenzhouxiangellaceae bacterium]